MLAGRSFVFSKNNLIDSSVLVIKLLPKVFKLLNLYEIALPFAYGLYAIFPTTSDQAII